MGPIRKLEDGKEQVCEILFAQRRSPVGASPSKMHGILVSVVLVCLPAALSSATPLYFSLNNLRKYRLYENGLAKMEKHAFLERTFRPFQSDPPRFPYYVELALERNTVDFFLKQGKKGLEMKLEILEKVGEEVDLEMKKLMGVFAFIQASQDHLHLKVRLFLSALQGLLAAIGIENDGRGKSLMELKRVLTWDGMEQELLRAMTDEEIMNFLTELCKPFAPGFPEFWPNLKASTPEQRRRVIESLANRRGFDEVWGAIADIYGESVKWIKDQFPAFGDWLHDMYQQCLEDLDGHLKALQEVLKELIQHFENLAADVLYEAVEFLSPFLESFGELRDTFEDLVQDLLPRLAFHGRIGI
ncbi:unnamed protein product [Darwinula stevensoni]|uniref:Uncharacterized protein n=1 Tax=Darwinula stevensoni TaxID=69355 RepID=A0A7R8XI13_9CRUS|nr:unnamed protein product [Darwinula stevensoni]CAG0890873.1 unnamed protein product [Darwinula stevensoni]